MSFRNREAKKYQPLQETHSNTYNIYFILGSSDIHFGLREAMKLNGNAPKCVEAGPNYF